MGLNFVNLNDVIRSFMLKEVEADIANNNLYLSQRLSETGQDAYPSLLKQAITSQNEEWLAQRLELEAFDIRQGKRINMPSNAAIMLAEGEFNRFYIRGLCAYALQNNIHDVVVYRAKAVTQARPESQNKIGSRIDAQKLLDDLTRHIGVDTALGVPSGPNSGLSVKLD